MFLFRSVLTALLLSVSVSSSAAAAPMPFPDMAGSFYRYREAVDFLQKRGVVAGYEDGTFRPRDTINRAEFLKIVFTGKSDTVPRARRCFSDVNPDAWFAPFVCAAKQRGIVNGYPDGTFKPAELVNTAEAIKIVLNAYGRSIMETPGEHWYEPYVMELDRTNVLARHSYLPWEPLRRERAADLLWRIIRYDEERIVPNLSPGCGKAAPEYAPSTIIVHDRERQFLLTVPERYVPHDPVDLIVAFHGRTNSNEDVRRYYRLDREASDAIIAYPAALKNDNGTFSWADPGNKAYELRDIALFDAIVETLAENYCINMDRISVVGHSLGAWMSNSLACVRGDVIMASATVGGDSVIADCSGPAAAMIVHNPKDTLSPFSGAERVRDGRLEENSCGPKTEDTGPASLKCVRYEDCDGGNDVLWCPHTQDEDERGVFYPHNWPKETAKHIVEFFKSIH